MLAPVAERVEVMGGVVAIVVTVSVALSRRERVSRMSIADERKLTGTSMRVMLDLKSESGSTSSTKACCPQLPVIKAKRMKARGIKNTNVVARALTKLYIKYRKM